MGHYVSVGVNPFVSGWITDYSEFAKMISSSGAYGAWVQMIHFSHEQVANMPTESKTLIGSDVIKKGMKRNGDSDEFKEMLECRETLKQFGLSVFTAQQNEPSEYWKPYYDCYPMLYPTNQEAVNCLFLDAEKHGDPGGIVYFEDYMKMAGGSFPPGGFAKAKSYITSKNRQIARKTKFNRPCVIDMAALGWSNLQIPFCPANIDCLSFASVSGTAENPVVWVDEKGLPIMVFDKYNLENYFEENEEV
jgi:hypothetical protein